jgi:hypothetical protein
MWHLIKLTKKKLLNWALAKTEEEAKKQATNHSRSTRNAPKWEAGDEAVKAL